MKLRNKKTGEVVVEINKIGLVWNKYGMPAEIGQYDSIAELNEEWEDYNPIDELVEQAKARARQNLIGEDLEKCCKALEAWARNTMTN